MDLNFDSSLWTDDSEPNGSQRGWEQLASELGWKVESPDREVSSPLTPTDNIGSGPEKEIEEGTPSETTQEKVLNEARPSEIVESSSMNASNLTAP